MELFLHILSNKLLASAMAGTVVLLAYFSIDIVLFFFNRDFKHINFYQFHFTRNDHSKSGRRSERFVRGGDALRADVIDYEVPLRSLFKNFFVRWRVVMAGLLVKSDKPVLLFGRGSRDVLASVRGRRAMMTRGSVDKRHASLPFVETKYVLCAINDRSGKRRRRILQVYCIRQTDLLNWQRIKAAPPKAGRFIDVFYRVAQQYEADPNNGFIEVTVIAG